jgi:transposase
LTHKTLQQLQKCNFDLLARQESNGQRRMRRVALAHLKEGKNCTEVASALPVTRHAVMRWLKWFASGGLDRLADAPHYWSTQRLAKTQEKNLSPSRGATAARRGDRRVRGR